MNAGLLILKYVVADVKNLLGSFQGEWVHLWHGVFSIFSGFVSSYLTTHFFCCVFFFCTFFFQFHFGWKEIRLSLQQWSERALCFWVRPAGSVCSFGGTEKESFGCTVAGIVVKVAALCFRVGSGGGFGKLEKPEGSFHCLFCDTTSFSKSHCSQYLTKASNIYSWLVSNIQSTENRIWDSNAKFSCIYSADKKR